MRQTEIRQCPNETRPQVRSSEAGDDTADESPNEDQDAKSKDRSSGSQSRGGDSPPPPKAAPKKSLLQNLQRGLVAMLKLVFYLIAAVLILWGLWRYRHAIWAGLLALIDEIRAMLAGLFGRRHSEGAGEEQLLALTMPPEPVRPFADFSNPFVSGMAENSRPEEVVRYTFEALEAWAREMGIPRDPEQTPAEFAQIVAQHETALAQQAQDLARLYAFVAYGRGSVKSQSLGPLRRFWQQVGA